MDLQARLLSGTGVHADDLREHYEPLLAALNDGLPEEQQISPPAFYWLLVGLNICCLMC